ncbi:MAG: DeoR/GlpR family DNA-binding transcription regulator [Spirochaetota bacterium]
MNKSDFRTIKLLEMLQVNKRLDVKTVAESLEISEATVRRLFAKLEHEEKVIRVHGGVQLAPELGYDYSYRISSLHRSKIKTTIGNHVAETIHDNERIFLDSGTTVLKLAQALSLRIQAGTLKNIVVLTNSLTHIETLAKWCKVILIGGEIRVERRDVCGYIAEKILQMFHVESAFFGADAINLKGGFMTTDERTSKMNEIVIEHADKNYVLADSEKFNKSSFITYAHFNAVDLIYTDKGLRKEVLETFRNAGARIALI